MRWLRVRFDCDSVVIWSPFDSDSEQLAPHLEGRDFFSPHLSDLRNATLHNISVQVVSLTQW